MLDKEKMSQLAEMLEQLRQILGNIKGTKGISETFSLCYIVLVEDEAARANVDQVAGALLPQAAGHGVELEIIATTQAELEEVQNRLAAHASQVTTFKV